MSKSFGSYKTIGVCTGSNTEFYRDRARQLRNKNRQKMRNVLANYKVEDFDDEFIEYMQSKRDDFREPTDGTFKLTDKELKKHRIKGIYSTDNGKIKK